MHAADLVPFQTRSFETEAGRMQVVDEGKGPPVVLVHGSAAWSFVYHDLVRALAPHHRCIVPDHLGFGFSDKPDDAPYRPADHAARLEALIDALELEDFSLVVHDFGGPIGLSVALDRPERVRSLVIFNTWMWPLDREPAIQLASRVGGGPLGRLLVERWNLEIRLLVPLVWGDRSRLDEETRRRFLAPTPRPVDRHAMWVLARELIGSSEWYADLWSRRNALRDHPALIVWGRKDRIFRPRHLRRWQETFRNVETLELPRAGHFAQVEGGTDVAERVREFLGSEPDAGSVERA